MQQKFFIVLFVTIFNCFSGITQNDILDSLKQEMKNSSGLKLSAQYLEYGEQMYYATGSGDTLKYFSNKALNLAKKGKSEKDQMFALKLKSVGNSVTGKFDESNENLNDALVFAKKLKDYKVIADINNKFGYNYQMVGELDSALVVYLVAAENFQKLKANDDLAIAYLNIVTVFSALKRDDEVKQYLEKMVALEPKISTPMSKIMVLAMATSQFAELGEKEPAYLSRAKAYGNKGIKLAMKHGIHKKTGQIYSHLGKIASIEQKPEDCIDLNNKALLYKSFMHPGALYNVYFLLSESYRKLEKNGPAKNYIDSLEKLPITYQYDNFKMQYYELCYRFYKSTHDLNRALDFHEKFISIKDSILDVERTAVVSELEQKFHRAQGDLEIVELNKDKSELNKNNQIKSLQIGLLIIGIIVLILVIMMVIYFYRLRLNRKQKEIQEVQDRLNRARMDPHFIFNVLTAIQSIALDETRKNEVSSYISRFSNLMRQSLESTYVELTTLENELDFITNYLELQQLLTSQKFKYSISVDDSIEVFDKMIPGMIIQPFLENSIEHGFKSMKSGGVLDIKITLENENIKIIIIDNGNGVDFIKEAQKYPSRATQIIKDRLLLIEKIYKNSANLTLEKAHLGGFHVTIVLPNLN